MDADESAGRATEIWTCAGARVGGNGKRVVAWAAPTGGDNPAERMLLFADKSGYAIGGRYRVTVTRDGGRVTMHGRPSYDGGRDPDDERVRQWRASEIAAEAELRRAAAERKHKGEDPLDPMIDPLVSAAKRLRTRADRTAFLAHVIERIQGGW